MPKSKVENIQTSTHHDIKKASPARRTISHDVSCESERKRRKLHSLRIHELKSEKRINRAIREPRVPLVKDMNERFHKAEPQSGARKGDSILRQRQQQEEETEKDAAERGGIRVRVKEKLEILRQLEEEQEREKLRKEIIEEERQKAFKAEDRRKKEVMLKTAAIDEWKLEQEGSKKLAAEEAEKRDRKFRERLHLEFGYTEEEISDILVKRKRDQERKEKEEREKREKEEKVKEKEAKETWIKVHHKYLLPKTLIAYRLPWAWDERNSDYIIIKRFIDEDFQEELFSHTKRLREGTVLTQTSQSRNGPKGRSRIIASQVQE